MSDYWTESSRFKLTLTVIGAVWLVLISGLMIADVWMKRTPWCCLHPSP